MKESASSSTASSSSCQIDPSPADHRRHCSSDQFIRRFNNYKSSGVPSRFFSFHNNHWVELPHQVFDELTAAFVAGKTVLELSVDGNKHLFDLVNMIQIDLSTKSENPIGWVDVNGRSVFPETVCEIPLRPPRFPGAEMLTEDDRFYKVVEKLFLDGMKRGTLSVELTSVHKCLYSGMSGESRMRAFQMMTGMTKAARGGDANVRFGWFGAPLEVVAGVVKHGFGMTNDRMLGDEAHGVGVHLSSPGFSYASSLLCEADEAGEKHILLCRIVMGKSEKVEAGSSRYHPSSDEFDSGVSDLVNPKWYIVWGTHMNTHILPEYIVSFRSSTRHQGTRATVNSKQKFLVSSGLSFHKLLSEIGRTLPPPSVQALELLYSKHRAGKISKDALIRYLRSTAGDKLLASTIKRIRGY